MNEPGWENIPKNISRYQGFVYRICNLGDEKDYIGCKNYWKTVKYPPLKGRKNKRRKLKETDWREYNSSSKLVQEEMAKHPDRFIKEILRNCETVSEMKVWEAYYQIKYYIDGEWDRLYNECINLRVRIPKNKGGTENGNKINGKKSKDRKV